MVLLGPAGTVLKGEEAASALKAENERFIDQVNRHDLKPTILILQGEVAHCDLSAGPAPLLGSLHATTCCK